MHARLRGSKSLLTLYQIINKSDFPSLADEIAEPHPDINIKVAAFTVSEKSSNTQQYYRPNFKTQDEVVQENARTHARTHTLLQKRQNIL